MNDPKIENNEKMRRIEATDPRDGVRFFGKMTASLSHDLKNYLAIINENAGLLEDLVAIAGDESPVDPQRVATVAGKIRHQVRRADEMIKRLNHVGHCVDSSQSAVDFGGLVNNVVALVERKAKMKAVKMEIGGNSGTVTITTDAFLLYQLVWGCINNAIDVAKGTLNIDIHSSPTRADLSVGPLAESDDTEKLLNLLTRLSSPLGIAVCMNSERRLIVLQFTRKNIE